MHILIEMPIGESLRRIRRARNISQENLADEVGVTQAYISAIENGKSDLDTRLLVKFAETLNVSVSELFEETEQKQRESASIHFSMPGSISERQRDRINAAVRLLENDEIYNLCEAIGELTEAERKLISQTVEALRRKR